MDYADLLRGELRQPHPLFQEYVLSLSTQPKTTIFLFFEGDEDPCFYLAHIISYLKSKTYLSFICEGRSEVIKLYKLIQSDGRSPERSLFFIDKDHTDIIDESLTPTSGKIFQTRTYSIENYLVSDEVFYRFWNERLHLSHVDTRYQQYFDRYKSLLSAFYSRNRILMAIVLIGRGVENSPKIKLNLNNVQLDRVFTIDLKNNTCRFKSGAGNHFLIASDLTKNGMKISSLKIRQVYRKYLYGKESQKYIRGKYELWFFWKILVEFTKELSNKEKCKIENVKRATPLAPLPVNACVESLSPLKSCPDDLNAFMTQAAGSFCSYN